MKPLPEIPQPDPAIQILLSAIVESRAALSTQIEELKVDFSLLPADVQMIRERMWEMEGRVSKPGPDP